MFSGKLLKMLIWEYYTPFCAFVRFVIGRCKSRPCLVLILCTAEFDLKASVFLTTNVDNENVYWG